MSSTANEANPTPVPDEVPIAMVVKIHPTIRNKEQQEMLLKGPSEQITKIHKITRLSRGQQRR